MRAFITASIKRLLLSILYARIEGRYRTLGVLFLGLWFAASAQGQVQLPPAVKLQYFSNNGVPLAGGCIFTYQSGTTTPLATYTDFTGGTPNPNPVVLGSDGRPPNDLWLLGQAYRIKLVAPGGVSCSTGTQIWVEDGVNPSSASLLSSSNTWTGTNTWQGTSNFNGPVNLNVGVTSQGPNNLGGGGSMAGTWSGSPVFSGTPTFSNGFTVNGSTATFNGPIILNGNPAMAVLFTTQIPNLNASFLEGATWEAPLDIGTLTPMDGTFVGLHATGNFQIASGALIGGTKGTDTTLLTAGTVASGAGHSFCTDVNGGATTSGCNAFSQIEVVKKTSSTCVITGGASYQTCSDTLTWPVAFADAGYVVTCTGVDPSAAGTGTGNQSEVLIINSYNASTVTVLTQQNRGGGPNANFTEIHCQGIHP